MANLGYVQVTRACNQTCRFCSNPPSGLELDLDEARRRVDGLAAQRYDGVILTGGEPTLVPWLPALVAHAAAVTLNVVAQPTRVDRESWEYVSQHGTDDDVLKFLEQHNLHRLDLEKIAFRMREPAFFRQAIALLGGRHVYHHTLWSYALKHNEPAAIGQFARPSSTTAVRASAAAVSRSSARRRAGSRSPMRSAATFPTSPCGGPSPRAVSP